MWNKNLINIDFFQSSEFYLSDNKGLTVYIEELHTIWWRRSVRGQLFNSSELEDEYKGFVNNEFEASLFGLLHSKFKGKWISHPFSTTLASNKIIQTQLALHAGFTLPKTLFSQDGEKITKFIKTNSFEVIIKPVYGSTKTPLYTQKIDKLDLPDCEHFNVCPAIYQEFVPGTTHLRINVFGDKIYPFMIHTKDLDWRQDITNPISFVEVDSSLEKELKSLLSVMDLQMGIFDFKVNDVDKKLYFFEVNPQGNFLFLEGVTKYPLTEKFADFIIG